MKYDSNLTLYEQVRKTATKYPSNLAIYYQNKKIKYKKFLKLIDKTAYMLENTLHLKKDDVITISLPNTPHALIILYAANKIGVVSEMIHPFTPYNQLKASMDLVNSKYAFVFEQRVAKEVDRYRDILDDVFVCRIEDYLPFFQKIFYHFFMNFRIRKKLGKHFRKRAFKYFYQLKGKNKKSATIEGCGDSLAVLLHSGSTTGDPKTIMISNSSLNFLASKAYEETAIKDEEGLVGKGMLSFLPSFHGFGLGMTMHLPFFMGMSCVLVPKFSPKNVVKILWKTNVSYICGVPSAFESLLNYEPFLKCKKIANLHVAFSGGDSLPVNISKKWNESIKQFHSDGFLFEGYGLTESIAAIIVNTPGHHKENSLGYPLDGVDVKIIKDDGKEAKINEIGEICIKSPTNMIGYLNDEKATKSAMRNGYVYTGDMGYKDEEGYIFFASRKKRVVKVSGVAVFPNEIEHLVESVRGVDKVCAIQIPDKRLQSAIKLIVVTQYLDKEGLSQEILDTCRKYLIKWAVPKEIEYRDSLPLTKLNKIDFKLLQAEEDKKHI